MKPKTETIINTAAMALIAGGTGELVNGKLLIGSVLVAIGGILEFVKYYFRHMSRK